MGISSNQIIQSNNAFLSSDFTDLSDKDVIDIFFLTNEYHLFTLNTDNTISFGKYILSLTGAYDGNQVNISTRDIFPSSSNIFISKNVYNENEYFFFYNKNDVIYSRTFNNKQGYFSTEKVLSSDYTIKQTKQVYENNIFILEVNKSQEIFSFIDDLPNKELKMGFLFTSEIENWNKTNVTPLLQIIELPFGRINEVAYSIDNLVGSDRGFIYLKGDNITEEYDERSINGNIVKNIDDIYTQLSGVDNYTLNIRLLLSTVSTETTILNTNNYEVTYDGTSIRLYSDKERLVTNIALDASTPCVTSVSELPNQLNSQMKKLDISLTDYSLLFITNTFYNNINVISLYVNGQLVQLERDMNEVNVEYVPDTYLHITSLYKIDYMSQQNYALSKTQISNLQSVFTIGVNSDFLLKNKSISFRQVKTLLFDQSDEIIIDNPTTHTIKNVTVIDTLDKSVKFRFNGNVVEMNNVSSIEGTGELAIIQDNITYPTKGKLKISYELHPIEHSIEYTTNHKLNSSYQYTFGKYLPIDSNIDLSLIRGTVVPYKITTKTGIPRIIFSDPTKQIRLGNSTSQIHDRVPFIIEDKYEAGDYIIWTSLDNFNTNGIPVQYGLKTDDIIDTHTYSKYETLSSKTYNPNEYFFAYHFNSLVQNNNIRIKNLFIEDSGELFLVGNSNANDYIREIKQIRFMDIPKKYKTNFFNVKIDTLSKDKVSFINNNKEIRRLTRSVIDEWKPSYTNLLNIEESNAIIMSNLLSDEFAQVLVGFTPDSNVNSYYVRSIEDGELDIFTSSGRFDENIDWLAIGRLDNPYVKAGVTKVNTPAKQFKIFFESKFSNSDYRVFVFSPTNSKYYVPAKDEDGFIVESSYLVEDEVSWIAVNSNQVVNGTLVWKEGIPEDEKRVSNLDRITEIGINSHKYTLNFNDAGFDSFDNDNYSVILSSDSNTNVWYTDKKLNSVDVRRSYTGQDMKIDYLIVRGNEKWFDNITG